MAIGRLLKNRWVLAGGGLVMAIYFVLLTLFLVRLLDTTTSNASTDADPDGPPALTLNRQGEVLKPDGKPLKASQLPGHLRQLLAKDPRSIRVTAPAKLPYRNLYEILKLSQAVGFPQQELQRDGQPGVPVSLSGEPKPNVPKEPETLSEDDLILATRTIVNVATTADGSTQTLSAQSPDGLVALPDLSTLTRYLKTKQEVIRDQDVVVVAASSPMSCGALLEVLEACQQAGYRRLELALIPPTDSRPFGPPVE